MSVRVSVHLHLCGQTVLSVMLLDKYGSDYCVSARAARGRDPTVKKNKTGQLHFFCVQFLCHRGSALYRKYASTHAVVMGLYPVSFIHGTLT